MKAPKQMEKEMKEAIKDGVDHSLRAVEALFNDLPLEYGSKSLRDNLIRMLSCGCNPSGLNRSYRHNVYSDEFRHAVVLAARRDGVPNASAEHGVSEASIYNWKKQGY